ncbi:lipase/acyltransferase domain-containing protein [Priestia megaterium]|uniref:lipase/acyltransferase domain-containing protein n=1 Tax=Priestia megaterium TaxID=1404 RepID=UPI001374A737|nr:hypothetical protein [Priestia megaterium]
MSYCVFIHGIQGSELHDGEDNKRWPVMSRRGMSQLDLNKSTTTLDTKRMNTFLGFKVYKGIDRFLEKKFKKEYLHYTFDWRFELNQHFEDLYVQLNKKKEIVFIAHSMGGLLTKLFIHWCNDNKKELDISKIITLGTPWQGAPESLYWIKYGDVFPRWWIKKVPAFVGLNTADVMMEISNTFPSVFQLLPHDHYIDNTEPILYDTNHKPVKNAYQALLNANQFKMYQTFSQTIQQDLGSAWPDNLNGKHFAIIGHELSTFGGIISEQNSSGGVVNKKGIKWTSGDGTVPVNSAVPLFKCDKYFIKASHLGLAQSNKVFKLITDILNGNQTQSMSSLENFAEQPSYEFSGRTYRVACPVAVTLESKEGFLAGEVDYVDNIKEVNDLTLGLEKTNIFRIEDSFFIFIDDDIDENEDEDVEENIDEDVEENIDEDVEENINEDVEKNEGITEENCNSDSDGILTTSSNDMNIEIKAYDTGLATVEVDRYYKGEIVQSKLFEGLEISPSTRAILQVPHEENVDNILLLKKKNGKAEAVKGFTLNNSERVEISKPKTEWKIQSTPAAKTDRIEIFASPTINIKIDKVQNVNQNEILEYRYILNEQLYHTNQKEFQLNAVEGLNKLTLFTITKSGLIDKHPKTIHFEIGSLKVVTNKEIILTNENVEVVFNNKQQLRDEVYKKTFVKYEGEEEYKLSSRIVNEYLEKPVTIHYYTVDKFSNEGNVEKIKLPTKEAQEKIFKSGILSVRDLMLELGLKNPHEWNVKVNNRTIKSLDSNITDKTRKIQLSLENLTYTIVLKEDYELFWEQGSTEIITSGVKELTFSFVIKRASSGSKVVVEDINDLKIKVFSKNNTELLIDMPIQYNKELNTYNSKLEISNIPLKETKGVIKVYYKDKPIRELKFTFE